MTTDPTDYRALVDAMTPGEWTLTDDGRWIYAGGLMPVLYYTIDDDGIHGESNGDLRGIVALVNGFRSGDLVPRAEVEALRAERDRLRELLRDVRDGHGCQPGYINTLVLARVEAALAKQETQP